MLLEIAEAELSGHAEQPQIQDVKMQRDEPDKETELGKRVTELEKELEKKEFEHKMLEEKVTCLKAEIEHYENERLCLMVKLGEAEKQLSEKEIIILQLERSQWKP